MVALRSKPAIRAAALPLLLPFLAAIGCAEIAGRTPSVTTAPPGFSADTFTRDGLISGATATEAGCRALPDGLWVNARDRRECLRFGASGMQGPARTALVYVPGDPGGVSYRFAGGRPYVERASEHYELSPETRDYGAEALSGAMGGMPVVLMARPGMHGSSGNHARDRHTVAEVELMDSALTALRERYGFQDFALFGFSSGGPVVANLLARRSDIRCAVIGSAPLDLALFYQRQDGMTPDYFAMRNGEFADPMRTVRSIRSAAPIFVIGDRRDRSVPASAWDSWVAAARKAGLHVHSAEIAGLERPELGGTVEMHHQTSSRGMEVAQACADRGAGRTGAQGAAIGGAHSAAPRTTAQRAGDPRRLLRTKSARRRVVPPGQHLEPLGAGRRAVLSRPAQRRPAHRGVAMAGGRRPALHDPARLRDGFRGRPLPAPGQGRAAASPHHPRHGAARPPLRVGRPAMT